MRHVTPQCIIWGPHTQLPTQQAHFFRIPNSHSQRASHFLPEANIPCHQFSRKAETVSAPNRGALDHNDKSEKIWVGGEGNHPKSKPEPVSTPERHNIFIDMPSKISPKIAVAQISQENAGVEKKMNVEAYVIDVPPTTPQPTVPTSHNDQFKDICLPLYRAALKGDWETAHRILTRHPDAIRARITVMEDYTVLHVAVASGHTNFVKNLVAGMTNYDLALTTNDGLTALMLAVTSGNVEIAKILVEKDRTLATPQPPPYRIGGHLRRCELDDEDDIMLRTPINLATLYGRCEMVRFLYQSIDVFDDSQFQIADRHALFVNSISKGIYDIALDMLKRNPELASARGGKDLTALHAMALKPWRPSKFPNSTQEEGMWGQFISTCTNMLGVKEMRQPIELELLELLWEQVNASMEVTKIKELLTKPWPLQFSAAKQGNVTFLTILFDLFPDLILMMDNHGLSLFHAAITSRQLDIFKLLCKFGSFKDIVASRVDWEGNNLLHYAALLPPHRRYIVSGAALELQRELLWFEEVKNVVPPNYEESMNSKGQTPGELFRDEHRKLMEDGEKWMKDTANSCMLVAALIATVVFAVAFTVPGGNEEGGNPVYLKKLSFKVFSILDAISLICSSTSILTFLSILTARYREEDFLWSLPSKLIVGLATLYISIITMMAAFGAAFFIIFEEGIVGVAVAVSAATCIPVMWYALMLRRVFVDVFRSIYMSSSFCRSSTDGTAV